MSQISNGLLWGRMITIALILLFHVQECTFEPLGTFTYYVISSHGLKEAICTYTIEQSNAHLFLHLEEKKELLKRGGGRHDTNFKLHFQALPQFYIQLVGAAACDRADLFSRTLFTGCSGWFEPGYGQNLLFIIIQTTSTGIVLTN